MAGIKYEEMPRTKRPFHPGRDTRREDGKIAFESLSDSLREDTTRAKMIEQAIELYPHLFRKKAVRLFRLIKQLTEGVETHVPPQSMASHLFTRGVRIGVIGNLWPLVEDPNLAPAVVATLRPTGMWVPTSMLKATKPRTLMRRLEADLHRAGFTKMDGYLLAHLHAEFDVNRDGYDFHYHLIAGGEMAVAIDKLREVRRFKPGRVQPHEQGLPESPRVVVSREPLYNLPDPLTYFALQSIHPHRPTTANRDGTLTRSKKRRRIPNPQYAEWLVWMNRWSVSDFMFCLGMSPTSSGFQLTSTK